MTARSEVAALTARIVADQWTNGEGLQGVHWPERTWQALMDAGLIWVGIDVDKGGSGGTLMDVCEVLWQLGASGVPAPVAETGLLAGWLLAEADAPLPKGLATFALSSENDRMTRSGGKWSMTAHLARVPWADQAASIVSVCGSDDGDQMVILNHSDFHITPGRNLAGEPRDLVVVDATLGCDQVIQLPTRLDRGTMERRGALSRAVLMAGAMEQIASLTVRYTNEREQFGKPIITFQAVANLVVQVVEYATAAGAATRAAILAGPESPFEVAVAKQQTNELSGIVASLAHQAHGAMGMTAEYELGNLTRRLRSWRQEYGSERYWSQWLGNYVVTGGPDNLWPRITRRDTQ